MIIVERKKVHRIKMRDEKKILEEKDKVLLFLHFNLVFIYLFL